MVKETGLYKLLGVEPSADEAELKKAYRKQALKYHPDKPTGDTEKFKEIGEAFDILNNKDKRALYDQYGLEAARHGQAPMPDFGGAEGGHGFPGGASGGGFNGFPGGSFSFSSGGNGGGYHQFTSDDAFNIFNAFGMGGGMGGMGGMQGMHGMDDDGGIFGAGGPGTKRTRASAKKPEPLLVKLPVTIEDLYKGTTKKLKISRRGASGSKESTLLEVNIKPGWKTGTKITFAGKGDVQPSGVAQDVVFELVEKPQDGFRRQDNDIHSQVHLSFKEAMLGFTKIINTIDGKKLKVSQVGPTRPDYQNRYPGRGMPISKHPGQHGDFVIEFKVDFPSSLTASQREAIEQNF